MVAQVPVKVLAKPVRVAQVLAEQGQELGLALAQEQELVPEQVAA